MKNDITSSPLSPYGEGGSGRILSLLRSSYLDRQLASGAPLGWSPSLATRARRITSTQRIRRLAENWERLLQVAHRPAGIRTPRVPLCRDRILAAEAEILELVVALSEARFESAAGVATASMLLRDGTGPLYNRRCKTDLAWAIQDVTRHLRKPPTTGTALAGS
jgi:hypothetical protein